MNNFILLEPSLRRLGIKFDAQVAYDIMQAKPGVIAQLLYQARLRRDEPSIELSTCYFLHCIIMRGLMRNVDLDEGPYLINIIV